MLHLRSVRTRLLLMVSAVVLAAVVAVGWSSRRVTRAEFRQLVSRLETEVAGGEGEADTLSATLQQLGDDLQVSLRRDGDWRDAQRILDQAAATLQERAALVIDGDDHIVAASDPALARARVEVTEDGYLRIGDWERVGGAQPVEHQEIVFRGPHVVLRTAEDDRQAVLYVLPPANPEGVYRFDDVVHEDEFLGSIDRWMLGVVIVVGIVALAAAAVVSARIVGPIERLTEAAQRMGAGDLRHRVEVDARDEIGELAVAFNAMAASLERNERLRRDMVSDVAHELRTPLTNLRAQLEAVQDGLLDATSELIGSLHEEAVLLGRLVDDLQELALAEAGQLRFDVEEFDVAVEIERVAAVFRRPSQVAAAATPVAAHSLEVDLSDDRLPPVNADRQRFRQVLSNLIDNAVRHGGGQVVVTAGTVREAPDSAVSRPAPPAAGFVSVAVIDRGEGIPREQLGQVFERFYRTDPSRQRATGGAGLGLAIVRQLVESQGGCVWVESTPGEGSTFGFCLPAAG